MEGKLSLDEAIFGMIDKPLWKPVRTHGSMFVLDVGRPVRREGGIRDHGEWSLLFEQASWSFEKGEERIVDSASEPSEIDKKFDQLQLGKVEGLFIDAESGSLQLRAESGIILSTHSTGSDSNDPQDQWLLYTPSGAAWIASTEGMRLEGN